jgi:hypothetical protein
VAGEPSRCEEVSEKEENKKYLTLTTFPLLYIEIVEKLRGMQYK